MNKETESNFDSDWKEITRILSENLIECYFSDPRRVVGFMEEIKQGDISKTRSTLQQREAKLVAACQESETRKRKAETTQAETRRKIPPKEELERMTIKQIKKLAQKLEVSLYKMRKAELIQEFLTY